MFAVHKAQLGAWHQVASRSRRAQADGIYARKAIGKPLLGQLRPASREHVARIIARATADCCLEREDESEILFSKSVGVKRQSQAEKCVSTIQPYVHAVYFHPDLHVKLYSTIS